MSTSHDWLRRDGMTIRQIAKKLRITPARVRQLESNALAKVRENPGLLAEFVDFDSVHGAKEGAPR